MKPIITFLIILLLPLGTIAQYEYDASEAHPFGQPNPEAPEQIKDWAPLIGECQCDSFTRNQDQTWPEESVDMIWRFKYIMNGTAVQDETFKADGGYSGSIRQFIADSTKWYVHYYSNKFPSTILPAWEGGKQGDSILLYRDQKAPNGMEGFYRITFKDMTEKGFNWIGEWVSTDESIVYPTWKIYCTRKEND